MPLAERTVPLQWGKLDTKTDSRFVVPGDLVALRNTRLDEFPKLRKRFGTQTIFTSSAGRLLSSFKSQLFLGTGAEAYGLASSGAIDKGPLEALTLSAQPAVRNTYTQQCPDIAVHAMGITVYAYESVEAGTTVARYSVYDTATQQPIVVGVLLSTTGYKPKPVSVGNYVCVLFADSSTNALRYVPIPAGSPTAPLSTVNLVSDSAASAVFDATVFNNQAYVAYVNNAGHVAVAGITPSGAGIGAVVLAAISVTPAVLSIWGDAYPNLWVVYYVAAGNVSAAVYSAALIAVTAPFTVATSPGTVRNITGNAGASTTSTIYYEVYAATTFNTYIMQATSTLAGSVTGPVSLARSVGLASKAFYYLGRAHVLAAFQSPLQPTYFLLSAGKVVAKLAPSNGGGLTYRTSTLSEVPSIATGVYWVAYLYADQLTSVAGNIFSQAGVNGAKIDFTGFTYSAELGDNLHITGGIVSMYDGAQVCEHGFHVYPEPPAGWFTATGSGGNNYTGSYQAVVVYEWMDNYGQIHQSAPSPALQINASGNSGFSYANIPTLRLTSKANKVSVVVYRTIANQSVFYRVTSIAAPLLNDPTVDTVSTTDAIADASLTGNAQLVFNPDNSAAEIPPLAPPALSFITRYRTRLVGIPSENPNQWIYSKAMVPGVPIEWNDQQFFQAIPQGSGPLTCAMEMDEKLILFSATRIMFVAGDGPAPNGANGDYGTAPEHIPTDVGCSEPRSLVLTPEGIMFKSAKGIYLLSRALQVSYIGRDAEGYNGSTITSARLVPNTRRILFTLSGGPTLSFDYGAGRWSEWTNLNAADSTVFGGLWTFVTPTGAVKQETPYAYTDDGSPILIGLKTGIVSFAGISGYQRVWRLIIRGDYRSPHVLQVFISNDDNPAPTQTETLNTASLYPYIPGDTLLGDTDSPGGGAFPPEEWMVKLLRQKCSSIQLTLQESQLGPVYGEGLSLSGVSFLAGVLPGLHRVPATNQI